MTEIYSLRDFEASEFDENLLKTELFIEIGSLNEYNLISEQFPLEINRYCKTLSLGEFRDTRGGYSYTIGEYNKQPIHVQFYYIILNGHYISLYHPTSQLVYFPLIKQFFKKYFVDIENTDNYSDMAKFCLRKDNSINSIN